jgi:hypothetical protein
MNETDSEVITAESGTVALLNKSEIDMQIATAHKFPRSIKKFRDETLQMVTLNEQVAQECIYSLPRDGKNIEGPSARFAEVVASTWGNSRAGARVVNDQGDFVTAQGVFHDLERNVAITYEVQRRIVDKNGRRFKLDMIGVTANAACSIALRNSILKGIPKAFWSDLYEAARETAIGNVQTLANRRQRALHVLQKMGVQPDTVFAFLKIQGQEDITLEHLATLFGITTALKEGDTTPEQAFAVAQDTAGKPSVSMPQAKAASPAAAPAPSPSAEPDPATGEVAAPSASVAPKPTPSAAPREPSGAGVLATDGDRKLILNRCRSNNIEVAALMEQAGIAGLPADLAGLTKDGFVALKDLLPKAA